MAILTRSPSVSPVSPVVERSPAITKPPGAARTVEVDTEEELNKPTRMNYRPDIDGIRGAAAIMVMGYHADVPGFRGGYIGLDLFFVVSGFVITNLLLSEYTRTGGIRWASFYARRARRLIPAKATMLLGVLLLSFFLMNPTGGQQETAESAGAAAGFLSNFYFWKISDVSYFGQVPGTGVLLHTWSLSVEEQFYLALPLLILVAALVARRFKRDLQTVSLVVCGLLVVGSLLLAMAWANPYPEAAYYLPITRAYEFLLGVGLALLVARISLPTWARQIMGLVGAALIASVLWQPMPTEGYPTYWALIPCFGAIFMVWAGTGSSTAITKFLSNRLFVALGLVSYGWYLWHWPFLVLGESVNLAPPPLWVRIALIMAALGVAYLSYRFIEGLFYNRAGGNRVTANNWASPRIVVAGVASMALVATTAGVASLIASEEAASPRWAAVTAQVNDFPPLPLECATPEQQIQQSPVQCNINDFDPDRGTMVIWGDSHAWMYIPSVVQAARGENVNIVAFNMGTCPPFDATELPKKLCSINNVLALDFVEDLAAGDQPLRVILGASWQSYFDEEPLNLFDIREGNPQHNANVKSISSFFRRGGGDLFNRLSELEVGVDVIAPIPEVPRSAPLCEARPYPLDCNVSNAVFEENESTAMTWIKFQLRRLEGRGRLIDISQELCDDEVCRAKVGDTLVFFDDNHLSATFARSVSDYFETSVRKTLPRPTS